VSVDRRRRRTKVLESWYYRDPCDVLEEIREERCLGCAHAVERQTPGHAAEMVCRKGKKYGKRCAKFKEKQDE
jgi:hypothetical protein